MGEKKHQFVFADNRGEFWTDERAYITQLHTCDASPEASLAIARVEVGVTTQLHSLTGIIERYIIRQGEGIIEINGEKQKLHVGDQAVIPAGAAQRIENTGTIDLEFYCLCTPCFFPDAYVNLE